ncbi:MAG: hypothetical protein KKD39_01420 [Candidatus Altiarchaeota archaeon]|nr:hypothetical protein [Candidatus Altiarchaeota archaeon]
MAVDIWGFESSVYPSIDSGGMQGKSKFKEKFVLGDRQYVEVSILNLKGHPLRLWDIVSPNEIQFRTNFWKDMEPWLRIDNDKTSKNPDQSIHFHLELDGNEFEDHQQLTGTYKLSELVSNTFEMCRKFLNDKYPNSQIKDSDGFLGSA